MNDTAALEILCKSPDLKFDILADALWDSRHTEPSTPVIEALLRLKKDEYDLNKIHRKLSWTREYIFKKLDGIRPSDCYKLLFVASMSVPLRESLIFSHFIEAPKYTELAYPNLYKAIMLINKEDE